MLRKLIILLLALAVLFGPVLIVRHVRVKETASVPLLQRVIAVDPGHGGVDPGALGPDRVHEKDIVLAISLKLRSLLQSSGAIVVMTRETDTDLSDASLGNQYSKRKRQDLERRMELVNNSGAEILISVHLNSLASSRWTGAQVFYQPGSEESQKLAEITQSALKEVLKNTNRSAAKSDHYVTRESRCPAVIVEAGFISNPGEARLLRTEEYQDKVAWAIYVGILRYLGQGK